MFVSQTAKPHTFASEARRHPDRSLTPNANAFAHGDRPVNQAHARGHRGELVGVPEAELAQQDPHCRARIHLGEHPGRGAGAQHVHIVDAVCAAHHARDGRGQLPGGFTAPETTRVLGSSTCSLINHERPFCLANSNSETFAVHTSITRRPTAHGCRLRTAPTPARRPACSSGYARPRAAES